MKISNIFSSLSFSLLLAVSGLSASAQSVEILGFTSGERASQIKAKVDLHDKSLSSVTAFSYDMTNGAALTSNSYELVDGVYLSANVDCWSGAYEYFQLLLSFDDGKSLKSECVNRDMSQAFFWLGDFSWVEAKSGWDDAHPPRVDSSMEQGINIKLDDVVYYKGISNHAPGYMVYDLNAIRNALPSQYSGIDRLEAICGVQDPQYYGNLNLIFKTDGVEKERYHMYAMTNTERPADVPLTQHLNLPLSNAASLRIEADIANGVNWGDHAELAMPRLFLTRDSWPQPGSAQLSFDVTGGTLSETIRLSSTLSGAQGRVYYRIVSGAECASLQGDMLSPTWGSRGEVVVEACFYGDKDHQPVSDYAIFYVDRLPSIEFLTVYDAADDSVSPLGYIYADTKGKDLEYLKIDIFDNLRELNQLSTINPSLQSGTSSPQIIPFELPENASADAVLHLRYKYPDSPESVLPYYTGGEHFDYLSDIGYKISSGWGSASVDAPYGENASLSIGDSPVVYKKGFGFHANGWVESTADLSPYYKFATDIGGHKITNNYRASEFRLTLSNGATSLADIVSPWRSLVSWEFPINTAQSVKIASYYIEDNTNNVIAVGAPRFYYSRTAKQTQELVWDETESVHAVNSVSLPLEAKASSGLPVSYRIVRGQQFASISGNNVVISNLPSEGGAAVVVEAYQPGDALWDAAPAWRKSFTVVKGLEIARDERVKLSGVNMLDELIVHADRLSSGQVDVSDGFVSVNSLVVKYSFIPGEWNFISFPSSVDIDKISDLNQLGYYFNNPVGPAYFIESYDTKARAESPDLSAWSPLSSPFVEGMKGYAMALDSSLGSEPVEVTFTFTNADLDLSGIVRPFNVSLDLSEMSSGETKEVTVTPVNVAGNELKVNVHFQPEDLSKLPMNYERALSEARFTFIGRNKAVRLTLPDQSTARMVFFKEGSDKVVKAVRYVSPMAVDVSELKPGSYNVVVSYGNAVRTFDIDL